MTPSFMLKILPGDPVAFKNGCLSWWPHCSEHLDPLIRFWWSMTMWYSESDVRSLVFLNKNPYTSSYTIKNRWMDTYRPVWFGDWIHFAWVGQAPKGTSSSDVFLQDDLVREISLLLVHGNTAHGVTPRWTSWWRAANQMSRLGLDFGSGDSGRLHDLRACLVLKNLAKWHCSAFRCYLANIVQLWSN
jgi:hypothetical protein